MIKTMRTHILLLGMAASLMACQGNDTVSGPAAGDGDVNDSQASMAEPIYFSDDMSDDKLDSIRIVARGYGSPPKRYYPEGQRKLMAMRAARLDAYRALAEHISGLQIWGGTTLGDMVVEKDQFQVLIEAYVLGAKVLEIKPLEDGLYEAVVEASVDQAFLQQVLRRQTDAIKPVLHPEAKPADHAARVTSFGGGAAYDATIEPNFYYSE